MRFKAKLRKIGNSLGVIVPKEVITFLEDKWSCVEITGSIYLKVITDDSEYMDLPDGVITSNPHKKENVITSDIPDKDKKQNVITPKQKKKKWVFDKKKGMWI